MDKSKSFRGKVDTLAQHQYAPGMNNSVWLSKVNGHLVSLSNVKVAKNNYQVIGNPTGSIYKNYKGGNEQPAYKGKTVAEAFEGKNSFLYRVYFKDKKRPMECIDIVIPKKAKDGHKAIAGLIYYQDNDIVKAADFRPKKI